MRILTLFVIVAALLGEAQISNVNSLAITTP